MNRLSQVVFAVLFFCGVSFAQAAPTSVTLDGDALTKTFEAQAPDGDKLIEFIRESESFESWTKLVGYRYQSIPRLGNDPLKTAWAMADLIKKTTSQPYVQVFDNKQTKHALLVFVAMYPAKRYVEQNVFRFWKSKDGKAVVSLQLAFRIQIPKAENGQQPKGAERILKEISDRNKSWLDQAARFDSKAVEETLLSQ